MPAKPKPRINDNGQETVSPIIIKDSVKFYTGSTFTSNSGDRYIVESYDGRGTGVVRFLDEYGYRTEATLQNIKKGAIRNPYHKTRFGGYVGVGPYNYKVDNGFIYHIWEGVLERGYSTIPKRLKISVCEEWYNLQNFAAWYQEYRSLINPKYYQQLEIDKDILQWNQEYKVYSPQTCCLVPHDLNTTLANLQYRNESCELPRGVFRKECGTYSAVGYSNAKSTYLGTYNSPEEAFEAYRLFKNKSIAETALFYLNDGGITEHIYNVLCNLVILPY